MKLPVTLIVLTYNEERHLDRCLRNARDRVEEILVVDSGSTDRTQEIAARYGAKVVTHPFRYQAEQFNWALDTQKITTPWILRLDADEYCLPELWEEMAVALTESSADIAGYQMKRRVIVRGRWIRHGGYYPSWFIRLFRAGAGRYEDREMDEHLLVQGRVDRLRHDFVDEKLISVGEWTDLHNRYATREAREWFRAMAAGAASAALGSHVRRRRWLKERLYRYVPRGIRGIFYFLYRYIVRLGFLDGREGFYFHFLQGCWYRVLVDAKIREMERER